MRGKTIRLSPMRRFVCDLLKSASSVPTVPVQRRMRLGAVLAARAAHPGRPPWSALFTKAYAVVATRVPELRRAYVKLPWPHLYEYPSSVASIAIEREYEGERAVFPGRIRHPEQMGLTQLTQAIRHFQQIEIDRCKEFRRAIRIGRMPWPIRRLAWWIGLNVGRQRANFFGTFCVTVYSGLGAESLHPISPLTTLNYGVIAADGSVDVRIIYDHRIMDGATVARALEQLEVELTGSILAELTSPVAAPRPAA